MPRCFSTAPIPTLVLALTGLAPGASADPFPLLYATPTTATQCQLPFDPIAEQGGDPSAQPIPPPIQIPLNVDTDLDLCVLNWSPSPATPTGTPCEDGTGPKSCAVKLTYAANPGIEVRDALPAPARPEEDYPDYKVMFDAGSVTVVGGDPILGDNGTAPDTGFPVARVTLRGLLDSGVFEMQFGNQLKEDFQLALFPNVVIATTLNLCGNGSIEGAEECDDNNTSDGDGCSSLCEVEEGFFFEGTAGSSAQLSFTLDGVGVTVDVIPGFDATQAATQTVATVNENATLATQSVSAVQALAPDQPPGSGASSTGRAVTSNGSVTDLSLVDSGGTLSVMPLPAPEPAVPLGFLAGALLLRSLARRRGR